MEILKASAPARVVNVASYWAGGLDLNDLEFTRRSYDNCNASDELGLRPSTNNGIMRH
jgi:hypothetical protein